MTSRFLRFLPLLPLCGSILLSPSRAATDPLAPPGTESYVYRELAPAPLRLYVFKPTGWKTGDRRGALVWFFGAGGKPVNSAAWASWAAGLGMIGVAPDYRERTRFGTTRMEAVADARSAVRWIEAHASELGIEPKKIVVGGNSAGGCLALWTAISHAPPGSASNETPFFKPAALILTSEVSDTSGDTGYENPLALSPVHQLDAKMPPALIFHGDADEGAPYQRSVALHAKLAATGNICEFITIPRGTHNYAGTAPAWWPRTQEIARWFLEDQRLIPK